MRTLGHHADFHTQRHMSMPLLPTTDSGTNVQGTEGTYWYMPIYIDHIHLLFSSKLHKIEGAQGRLGQL